MRDLKGRDIRALVDGKRVTVVSGISKKSRVVPLGNVSRRRVKISIDVELVARKRGKNKNLGAGERRCRRGGGRNVCRRGGGGKNAGGGGRSSIGSIFFLFSRRQRGENRNAK